MDEKYEMLKAKLSPLDKTTGVWKVHESLPVCLCKVAFVCEVVHNEMTLTGMSWTMILHYE